MTIVQWSQPSSEVLCIQNNDLSIRITSRCGSQTSPVDLWMQNRVLRSRRTLVYWTQPSSVVLCIQNSDLTAELLVSMGPSPHLWFCAFTTATLWQELIVSMGHWLHLSFCTCKTAWLVSEILISIGPRWFLHAKQLLLDQNYKSQSVPGFACWFVNAKQRA